MKKTTFTDDVINLLVTAGDIMLKSGAEIYRVEETLERIGHTYTKGEVEVFATPTGFVVSLEDENGITKTRVKRIKDRNIDLTKIVQINNLSRRIALGDYGLLEAKRYVNQVGKQGEIYPLLLRILAHGITAACYAYVFGGKFKEVVVALFIGIVIISLTTLISKTVNRIFTVFIGGIGIALIAGISSYYFNANQNAIIMGSIMLFVPGVALTNAVRDALNEDYLSAAARGVEALLVSLSVAAGVALVIGLSIKYAII
jgi:uncharacterized membrane protein YjjP (DUF1212 family)